MLDDGRATKVRPGKGRLEDIIEVAADVGEGLPTALAFRATSRLLSNTTVEYKILFKNWDMGLWDVVLTQGTMPTYWNTTLAKITDEGQIDDYVDGSGNVLARITARKYGPSATNNWQADFEQGVWMYK